MTQLHQQLELKPLDSQTIADIIEKRRRMGISHYTWMTQTLQKLSTELEGGVTLAEAGKLLQKSYMEFRLGNPITSENMVRAHMECVKREAGRFPISDGNPDHYVEKLLSRVDQEIEAAIAEPLIAAPVPLGVPAEGVKGWGGTLDKRSTHDYRGLRGR
jgi:hypothetical protein